MSVKIRAAVDSDLPAIIDIYNAAVATRIATAQLEPVPLEERRDWLKEHSLDRHRFGFSKSMDKLPAG